MNVSSKLILETIVTNQNVIHDEIICTLNVG